MQVWRFRVEKRHLDFAFTAESEYYVTDPATGQTYFTILLNTADQTRDWVMGGSSTPAEEAEVTRPQQGANRQAGSDAAASAPHNSSSAAPDSATDAFLALYKRNFGRHEGGQLVRVMEAAARFGKISPPLPQYEFASKRCGGRPGEGGSRAGVPHAASERARRAAPLRLPCRAGS